MPTQIGLQLYTLRSALRTPAEIAQSLARVRKIGYEAVELAGLGQIDPAELAKIMAGEGLTCCSSHVSTNDLHNQMQRVIDNHKLWKCPQVVIASFNPREQTAQAWIDFADDCNKLAQPLAAGGLALGYHNHNHEMVHYDGKPALQILSEHVSPQVFFEVDLHWIVRGGGDPAQWVEKLAGHVTCLHMKDMSILADRNVQFSVVGEGNLNWPRIISSAKQANVKWYIVEQDDTYGQDPFDCIARSLKNMKAMGLA